MIRRGRALTLATALLAVLASEEGLGARDAFEPERAAMSAGYWDVWNDAVQARIDADIEANRKADAVFAFPADDGTDVKVEQIAHEFRFGAHVFNFNQLGSRERNEAYRRAWEKGGIFNSATVAFYWRQYEPLPGQSRWFGTYEDTERFWNSLTREEAEREPYWRRPSAGPVIAWLRSLDNVRIHGHTLAWGSDVTRPTWIYDLQCPEAEKSALAAWGISNAHWGEGWRLAFDELSERDLSLIAPTLLGNYARALDRRIREIAARFGDSVDSWDVVNEATIDWNIYQRSRTGLPAWKSGYGLMPADYPRVAFEVAAKVFPTNSSLNINDYLVKPKGEYRNHVRDLMREGCKVDAVGWQMHLFDTNLVMRLAGGETKIHQVGSPQMVYDRYAPLAELGLPIHISEVTIPAPGTDERSRQIQANLAWNLYRLWFSLKNVHAITWWNVVDGGGYRGEPKVSGLFTEGMEKKAAYRALEELVNRRWRTALELKVRNGKIAFRGFRGKYRFSWENRRGERREAIGVVTGSDSVEPVPVMRIRSRGVLNSDEAVMIDRFRFVGPFDSAQEPRGEERMLVRTNGRGVDLAKLVPGGLKPSSEPKVAGVAKVTVTAPTAMRVRLHTAIEWYGEVFVNGEKVGDISGCPDCWTATQIDLREGKNEIAIRTRPGVVGLWSFGWAIDNPGGRLALEEQGGACR